ncbi:hypothetical protein EV424DRAFT_1531424 [Suillus variegatus]|nr:hypothetical protein EV424DRAFT_1531424 [Suillus variegatus]
MSTLYFQDLVPTRQMKTTEGCRSILPSTVSLVSRRQTNAWTEEGKVFSPGRLASFNSTLAPRAFLAQSSHLGPLQLVLRQKPFVLSRPKARVRVAAMLPVSLSRLENIVQPTSGHLRLLPSHRSAGVSRSTTVASSFFAGFLPQSIEMDMESARFVSCSNFASAHLDFVLALLKTGLGVGLSVGARLLVQKFDFQHACMRIYLLDASSRLGSVLSFRRNDKR